MGQTGNKKRNTAGWAILFCGLTILYTVSFTSIARSATESKVNDTAITDTVENDLLTDVAVQSSKIDVTTKDGVVYLKGKIGNILSKDRAANIARTVKGVKSVVNEIQVDPPLNLEDWQIKEFVENALQDDPVTSRFKIGVSVKYSVVTLTGAVGLWKERQICENAAKSVKGVKNVVDLIDIDWSGNVRDEGIKKEIDKLLRWDASIDNAMIDVTVDQGKVYLKGAVGSAIGKLNATLDCYVNGVKSVDNSGLDVTQAAGGSNRRDTGYIDKSGNNIAQAVRDALMTEPRVSLFKISVEVDPKTHEVTLRGTVHNLKAKNTAASKAMRVTGVRSVDNRIKVRPKGEVSDQWIEKSVKKAINRDPYLDGYVIEVVVTNGVVKLYGDVDTVFEKTQAEDVTAGINGVLKVENNLIVRNFSNTYVYDPWVNDTFLYDFYWYQNLPLHPQRSDAAILKETEDRLFWNPFVNSDKVKVEVDKGVVTLTGNVNSWLEYDAAMKNAYQGGAIYVKNNLKVK